MTTIEAKSFVQQAVERGKQEALNGVIDGSLSVLHGVGIDHSITPETIQAAQENLSEAVAISFGLTDPREIEEKVQELKREAHRIWSR